MGAGRGTNRVGPIVASLPEIADLTTSDEQENSIVQVPATPYQYLLEVPANDQVLTGTFELWEDGTTGSGATSFKFPLGAVRASIYFTYTSGIAGGQAQVRPNWSKDFGVGLDLLVANTVTFAPAGFPALAEVPLSIPVYKTPPATAGSEVVAGSLDLWVPPGVKDGSGDFGSISFLVRDVGATPGTLRLVGMAFENYGAPQPTFPIQ